MLRRPLRPRPSGPPGRVQPRRGAAAIAAAALFAASAAARAEGAPGARPTDLVPFGKPAREAFFQFEPDAVYFNHGGYGATPRPVRRAAELWTDKVESQPTKWFGQGGAGLKKSLAPVRARMAEFVGADPADLAFLDDASAGLNGVLRSVPWAPGDIVLLIGSVYAASPNILTWLAPQRGLRIVNAPVEYPVAGDEDYLGPVRRAFASLTDVERLRVRLAMFDHISSYPPVVLPAEHLARLVKAETNGRALVFVDGAHALGQIPLNISSLHAAGVDMYVTNGHKWLMAPHGSALLWAAPEQQAWLQPDVISSANPPGTPFQGRFDYIGTRDYAPWCAMGDALDFRAQELGGERRILGHLADLAGWASERLPALWGTRAVAPRNMTGGMVAVQLPIPSSLTPEEQLQCATEVMDGLADAHHMQIVAFPMRTPEETFWARISAMVYLDREDFEKLAAVTLELIRGCAAAGGRNAGVVV